MAKFTNVSGELRFVNHGLRATQAVPPDEVLEVPDDVDVVGAYACQPDVWAAADEAASSAAQAAIDAAQAPPQPDETDELAALDQQVADHNDPSTPPSEG